MFESACRAAFIRFAAINPSPKTELLYTSHFELLIAVMLSAQATDKSVNLATRELFRLAPTPETMLTLGLNGIESHIQRIGLFKTKARHILATCQQLISLHHSAVPSQRSALEALPGVGRKTANVVLNTAFNQPVMAVDTHIFRVANRTGMGPGKNVNQVEHALMKIIPKEYLQHAHHWLILHGRYTCTARKPRCETCLIADLCEWPNKVIPVK
ncbi:MAG: endonuclease III [Betaproteobacteria bacterium]|nr:endonuclease III [Betaproteobacteria bacterium]